MPNHTDKERLDWLLKAIRSSWLTPNVKNRRELDRLMDWGKKKSKAGAK